MLKSNCVFLVCLLVSVSGHVAVAQSTDTLPDIVPLHRTVHPTKNQSGILSKIGTAMLSATTKKAISSPAEKTRWGVSLGRLIPLAIKSILVLAVLCVAFLYFFFARDNGKDRFLTDTRLSTMDKEVQRACRYLEEHYADPQLTVESACSALITGPAFLQALYERELGMSVEEFLSQVRINRARQVLEKNRAVTIEDLAHQVGYSTVERFCNDFERINTSPLEQYRASLS